MDTQSSLRNQKAYDIWSVTYDNDRPPHTFLEERTMLELLAAGASDYVLDAACGSGRYAKLLSQAGIRVSGCDLSSQMLARARAKCPEVDFVQADLNKPLPYANESFSKAICSLSVRHIENLAGFCSEMFRVLRPGATFVVSSIHPEMDWATYERATPPPIELNEEGQIFPYSVTDFLGALGRAGFFDLQIVELRANQSVRPFLTPESFQAQLGKKYVLILSADRP